MKKVFRICAAAFVLLSVACSKQTVREPIQPLSAPPAEAALRYTVDLTQRQGDLFRAQLEIRDIPGDQVTLQFPASAPGTYQTMDIGRYVRDLSVANSAGEPITVEKVDVNQWRFSNDSGPIRIQYTIAETWDTKVDENPVFPMAGTSLEDDHALICPHATFPFPLGYQDLPVALAVELPSDWQLGTAMPFKDGWYHAEDYDQFVDSPILAGTLSVAKEKIDGCEFSIYVYSKSGKKDASVILDKLRPVIDASSKILNGFPNDHYAFIFHFENYTHGAWEHAYSSNYVLSDTANEAYTLNSMVHMAAHEVFHMITPLHIHSEMVDPFDFENPNPSKHLWFYEGVTEWAARIMMLRAGYAGFDDYFKDLQRALMMSGFFRNDVSLTRLGEMSFSPEGQALFPNVYMKGSLTAAVIDLEILKQTGGRIGLREVILDLAEDFGPQQTFTEAGFFDEIAERSGADIRGFLETYLSGTDPLPLERCFDYVGVNFDKSASKFSLNEEATAEQLALRNIWASNRQL